MRRVLVAVAALALCGCYESHEPFSFGNAIRPCIVGIWNCYPGRDNYCGPGTSLLTTRPWADCAFTSMSVVLPNGTIRFAVAYRSEEERLLDVQTYNRRSTSIEEQGLFEYWEIDGDVIRITVGYGYEFWPPGVEQELRASSCVGDRETELGRALEEIQHGRGPIFSGTCERLDRGLEALIFPLFDDEPARDATFHF